MADARIRQVEKFFSGTGLSYNQVVRLWTLGLDVLWKQKILRRIPGDSTRILDQACGTGILTFKIARKFPRARVFGVELRLEYLALARQKAEALKIINTDFIQGRAEDVFLRNGFDCIVSSYLAKYAELNRLIKSAGEMLRPGGTILLHDFSYPENRAVFLGWNLNFKIMQKFGSRIFPEWKTVFYELPEFIEQSNWITDLTDILLENGFSDLRVEPCHWGLSTILTGQKP